MDAATLVTIITMFIVTDTASEFVKYDGLMDCMKDKREIERKKDGRKAIWYMNKILELLEKSKVS